ncbi:MAG: hypothetical protein M3Z24_03540 [Chloroflexota bacterium]|nr:hypothetical protein [Chloroflexota bacterium]
MKKIRCYLAAIALVTTLSGLSLQGLESGSLANATSNWHVKSPSVVGKLTKSVASKPYWPCPVATSDC